jgi:hypothetical protein
VRDALTEAWGARYGLEIRSQKALESPYADTVVHAITSKPNALSDYQQALAERLDEARLKREQDAQRRARRGYLPKTPSAAEQLELQDEPAISKRDASAHTKAQSELLTLGKITGCSVWIASNDQGRTYAGNPLAADCLKKLPRMGLGDEAMRRISLIDVIWVSQNAPVCAFEVETSTTIYSGLLRMSDLLAVVPALNIQIYIVAPRERQNKVLAELSRPTFHKIGLSEYCRYIPSEELSKLITNVKGYGGHIQPSILDTIAIALEDEQDEENP